MKTTTNFRLLMFCIVCIGVPVLAAVSKNIVCTIYIYEPEIDPDYRLTDRDLEIREAYSGNLCHWSWEVIPPPSEYVTGSGPVRPILLSEWRETERLRLEQAMREEAEWLKAKYPELR